MILTTVELAVFNELARSPKSGITKAEIAHKNITYNLGDIIMKLRRKGADITTEMKINAISFKRFAVYRMKK